MKSYKSISEYIKGEKGEVKEKLEEMLALSRKLVPKSEETIRYGIPTIRLNDSNLFHFASMKGHFGFYPTSSGVKAFETELQKLKLSYSKGCIRLPYDKPLPIALLKKIIMFRLKELKNNK